MIEIQPNPYTGGKRLVVVGTLGNPETVTQKHFDMLDGDARSSHLERFIAEDLDLTGFDLRDVTTLDGTIANSDLYEAKSTYWYSRGCVFPGTDIPRDASSLNHDFARTLTRDYISKNVLVKKEKDALESIDRPVYTDSWDDSIDHMIQNLGMNEPEVLDILTKAFSRHIRMKARLRLVMEGKTWKAEKFKWPWPEWDASKTQSLATNPNDRMELRQILDDAKPGTSHYVYLLKPEAFMFIGEPGFEWDWWGKRVGK